MKMAAVVLAVGLGAAVGLVSTAWAGEAKNGYQSQKIVYHINDLESASGGYRNVRNHLDAVGDEHADLVVVVHSRGALSLVDGTSDSRGNTFETVVQELADRGVRFQFCANTIQALNIDRGAINPNAEIVPSGVAHVAHLQQQGYVYVKP